MMSRTLRKSILDTRIPNLSLPPTFLLPFRTRYFNSTTQHVEPSPEPTPLPSSSKMEAAAAPASTSSTPSSIPTTPPTPTTPPALSESVKELLPLLRAQPSHFITAHIHARPYLVTAGDIVRLPFHMPGVIPGDILRLNRASSLGSRDYTLKGAPYLDERIFECRARVMGTEAEPMRIKQKKKQRNRRIKTVRSKHKFTVLRISEVKVLGLEEIEG